MIDAKFLDQLKNLNFFTRKKVSSVYAGSRSSVMHGKGIELYDHREYFSGDDFRAIDWKLYGRTEKLYIRRFEEERDFTLHILLDTSASMDFSMGGMRKFDYAGSIAAGFGYTSLSKQEKFALALYSDRISEVMQPKKGKLQFFRMIDLLNGTVNGGDTHLGDCMSQYASFVKTKSFFVVLSDFLEPLDSLKEGIYRLARRSKESILVQVLDPGEINLTWRDDMEFEDMEILNSEKVYLSPDFKKKYTKRLLEHIYAISEICDDTGIDFVSVTTDKPLFDSFVQIIERRTREGIMI